MPMARIRGPGRRGKDTSRATAAVLISATVVLAALVGVGVVAFLHSRSANAAQGAHLGLPDEITSQQSVGLANLGRTGRAGSASSSARLLFAGAGGLVFTPTSDRKTFSPVSSGRPTRWAAADTSCFSRPADGA